MTRVMIDTAKIELPTPISTDGPPVDVPLLRKAVEWAEAEAAKPEGEREWYQGWFITPGEDIGRSCGTAFCIAGWVAAGLGKLVEPDDQSDWLYVEIDGREHAADSAAATALGLTGEESRRLFGGGNAITDIRTLAERIAARAGQRL